MGKQFYDEPTTDQVRVGSKIVITEAERSLLEPELNGRSFTVVRVSKRDKQYWVIDDGAEFWVRFQDCKPAKS